jgi:hypothetical protein
MKKDYIKILWKIEELWKKYYKPMEVSESVRGLDISGNYKNGISKYHHRFNLVKDFDFTESQKPVFFDDYGKYNGLKKCQILKRDEKLIYLFDNHNEMLYPLVEISEITKKIHSIVHIDAHPDNAEFQEGKPIDINLQNVQEYIIKTRISDFFDAVSETKMIGNIYSITHSDSFEFFLPPEEPYILSLDIDIFGPEGNFCELEDKVRAIAVAWARAEVVCIAMSPGFIDQDYAKEIIEIFEAK